MRLFSSKRYPRLVTTFSALIIQISSWQDRRILSLMDKCNIVTGVKYWTEFHLWFRLRMEQRQAHTHHQVEYLYPAKMSVMWCIFIASCCEHYPDIIPMFLGHEAWAAACQLCHGTVTSPLACTQHWAAAGEHWK